MIPIDHFFPNFVCLGPTYYDVLSNMSFSHSSINESIYASDKSVSDSELMENGFLIHARLLLIRIRGKYIFRLRSGSIKFSLTRAVVSSSNEPMLNTFYSLVSFLKTW